jgi:hypothetical protein
MLAIHMNFAKSVPNGNIGRFGGKPDHEPGWQQPSAGVQRQRNTADGR